MRLVLSTLCFLLAIAAPSYAQGEKAKTNTLTAKEIADGWILLFDGETTFGWEVKGKTRVADGAITLPDFDAEITHSNPWRDLELRFESRAKPGKNPRLGGGGIGLIGTGAAQGLPRDNKWHDCHCIFQTAPNPPSFSLSISVDGVVGTNAKNIEANLAEVRPTIFGPQDGSDLELRNIKLRPLNTKSIFNAKDLDGWRVFSGDRYKSIFTVKDAAINVKDGPGDLQTVGKYKDFILQFDCISNGKHLNSGIFFRCRDNEYQNGYEAQIRNEFKAEPQKYLVEDYDPKTNKLIGKKEVLSPAFDFGTGAIYRRVPARKQMSKDNEWFTMTVLAHGNHLATWVNGVQQTDWTDNRPKSDNARTGCKLDAGHISIQGHDPTTDLSFKNFRIAEFK